MEPKSFEKHGAELLQYVTSYLENIRSRPVLPDVRPGFLRELVPDTAPELPESWEVVFQDIERIIMPGVLHFQSPRRFSAWTIASSYPSILGDLLTNAIGSLGLMWEHSPMGVELEMAMLDWLARMLQLPPFFLFSDPGQGGGIVLANASEATLTCLLAARKMAFTRQQQIHGDVTLGHVIDKLVAYSSEQVENNQNQNQYRIIFS